MAFDHCVLEVEKIAGRALTSDESAAIQDAIKKRAEARRKIKAGEKADDAMALAGQDLGSEVVEKELIKKRNAANNLKARLAALDRISRHYKDDPWLGIKAMLVGDNRPVEGARASIDARQKAYTQGYLQTFAADLELKGVWEDFVRGTQDAQIADATYRLGSGEDISALPKTIKTVAQAIHDLNNKVMADANRAGAWIKETRGYIVRQSHDTFKIRKAGFEKWYAETLPKLDLDKTFWPGIDARDAEKGLRNIWRQLGAGIHIATDGDVPDEIAEKLAKMTNVGKRLSHSRELIFKNGAAWFDYNSAYGTGSLREALIFGMNRAARNIGMMEVLGPNPEMNLTKIIEAAREQALDSGVDAGATMIKWESAIERMYDQVSGKSNIPGSISLARIGAGLRMWMSISKLGGAVLSSITDVPNVASELRYNGVGYLEGYGKALAGLGEGRSNAEKRRIYGALSVSMKSIIGDMASRFSADDSLPGNLSRFQQTFFKWNGLGWWTDTMRATMGRVLSMELAEASAKSFDAIDTDLRRVLGLFNIDAGIWDMMRRVQMEDLDGEKFLTGEMARAIPLNEIKTYLGGGASDRTAENFRHEIEMRFRQYFSDRVEFGALEPDARTRAAMLGGTRPGTPWGEVVRFIMQFKSFGLAQQTKVWGRNFRGYGVERRGFLGTLREALTSGRGERLAIAHTIVMSTVFGYLAAAAKDLSRGKTPRQPNDPSTWSAALLQGGGFGIYGDFLLGENSRFGRSALETAAGPVLSNLADLDELRKRAMRGDDTAAASFRFAVNNTPFVNLFYTRMAMDYLITYRIQEELNPGALRRMERRMKNENGQTYFINPSEAVR